MRLIIDTNAYAELARGNPHVRALLEHADEIVVSAIVMGELHAGFRGGSRRQENERQLREFLAAPGVHTISVDESIAERYGEVVRILKAQGTPIPTNGVWIAATALETGCRVLSLDTHFQQVPGLMMAM